MPEMAAYAQFRRTNTPEPTRPLQTASLATFRGDALTDLLAGLAANSIGSFVKGFTPLRASVAGLFTIDILTKPGTTNSPDSFNSLYPTVQLLLPYRRHVLDDGLDVSLGNLGSLRNCIDQLIL